MQMYDGQKHSEISGGGRPAEKPGHDTKPGKARIRAALGAVLLPVFLLFGKRRPSQIQTAELAGTTRPAWVRQWRRSPAPSEAAEARRAARPTPIYPFDGSGQHPQAQHTPPAGRHVAASTPGVRSPRTPAGRPASRPGVRKETAARPGNRRHPKTPRTAHTTQSRWMAVLTLAWVIIQATPWWRHRN
jgi:hypothetical protein